MGLNIVTAWNKLGGPIFTFITHIEIQQRDTNTVFKFPVAEGLASTYYLYVVKTQDYGTLYYRSFEEYCRIKQIRKADVVDVLNAMNYGPYYEQLFKKLVLVFPKARQVKQIQTRRSEMELDPVIWFSRYFPNSICLKQMTKRYAK